MSETTENTQVPKTRRLLVFVLLGLFLWCAAGLLAYDRMHVHTTIAPLPQPYVYTTQQSVHDKVSYHQSSFFNGSPDSSNTAYISTLTDTISAQFPYHFIGSKATQVSYRYEATAVLRSTFGSRDNEEGVSNVWSKQYQLIKPVTGTKVTKSLTLNPALTIPYAEYKKQMDQFKDAFNSPLNGELVVTYNVQVNGKVNGTPFIDTKVSTITASLDQEIYQLAVKYTKNDRQEVVPVQTKRLEDTITTYEMPVAIILFLIGFAYIIYGFRKQIFKTPYMRELERIYRYHDGLIIRASRPPNIANKSIVQVQSFDDLLNIEEEIKAPIVASPAGDTATRFIITRDDVVYVFVLGELPGSDRLSSTSEPTAERRRPENKPKLID